VTHLEHGPTPDHAGTSLSFVPGPSLDADRIHPSNLPTAVRWAGVSRAGTAVPRVAYAYPFIDARR